MCEGTLANAPAGRRGSSGVQGLDAAVHHLGKAGVLGHLGDRQAGLQQQLGGAAGGQQLASEAVQALGEFEDAGLVGDR
jgi:hypothetical protein